MPTQNKMLLFKKTIINTYIAKKDVMRVVDITCNFVYREICKYLKKKSMYQKRIENHSSFVNIDNQKLFVYLCWITA